MKKILPLLIVAVICLLFSCKKNNSNPEPEVKGIPIFDIIVYDSDLWTPQNRLPIATNVEVEVYETTYALNYAGQWKETDSLKHIFTGITSQRGVVKVMRDGSLKTNMSFYVKLKRGNRSNYSPEGYQCEGIFETQTDILTFARIRNVTPKVGDERLLDYNRDGVISNLDKNNPGIYIARHHDNKLDNLGSCWLY